MKLKLLTILTVFLTGSVFCCDQGDNKETSETAQEAQVVQKNFLNPQSTVSILIKGTVQIINTTKPFDELSEDQQSELEVLKHQPNNLVVAVAYQGLTATDLLTNLPIDFDFGMLEIFKICFLPIDAIWLKLGGGCDFSLYQHPKIFFRKTLFLNGKEHIFNVELNVFNPIPVKDIILEEQFRFKNGDCNNLVFYKPDDCLDYICCCFSLGCFSSCPYKNGKCPTQDGRCVIL